MATEPAVNGSSPGTDEFRVGCRRRDQLRLFEMTTPKNPKKFQVVKHHSIFARVRRVTWANSGCLGWIGMYCGEDLGRNGFLCPLDELFPRRRFGVGVVVVRRINFVFAVTQWRFLCHVVQYCFLGRGRFLICWRGVCVRKR